MQYSTVKCYLQNMDDDVRLLHHSIEYGESLIFQHLTHDTYGLFTSTVTRSKNMQTMNVDQMPKTRVAGFKKGIEDIHTVSDIHF